MTSQPQPRVQKEMKPHARKYEVDKPEIQIGSQTKLAERTY